SSTFDGAVVLDGILGEEDGTIVNTAINALATPSGPDDQRTPSQRRADALVELCRRALANRDVPTHGGEPTHLIVITDLATLEARTGGLGELPNGSILRGDAVRRLACDARISRIITGPDSQPLDVGRSQRTATPAQRKALRLRDRGCIFPGCDRPPEWTDVHHLIPWAQGGHTDIDEMALLCRKHHTVVHEGGWTMLATGPRRFRFVDPHGVPVPADPIPRTTSTVTTLINTTQPPPRAGPTTSNDTNTNTGCGNSGPSQDHKDGTAGEHARNRQASEHAAPTGSTDAAGQETAGATSDVTVAATSHPTRLAPGEAANIAEPATSADPPTDPADRADAA
ncbi:HNH endonuclease signature motif containing protein, partial [Phytoactinopolyspora mesophila]